MKKIVFAVAALMGMWGSPSWAVDQAPADVEAAIQEAVKLPPGSKQLFKAVEDAMSGWVKKEPAEAFEWATKQEGVDKRRHYLPLVVAGVWVKNDLAGALAFMEKLPPDTHGGMGCFVSSWAAQDSASASAWASKQPKERWPVVINAVAEPWARRDPKAAAAWISSLPPDQGRYGYAMTASAWAWADPVAAAAWIGTLPAGDARNHAAAFMAGVWTRKNPGDAQKIQDWLKGITTPGANKEQSAK